MAGIGVICEHAAFSVRDASSMIKPVLIDGRYGRMMVNPNDVYIGRSLVKYGEFSPVEAQFYNSIVRPGQTVIEAGANLGCFTLQFAQLVGPNGRVLAFEPQRQVFQMLCGNLALNGISNTETWQAALGSEPGQLIVPVANFDAPGNFGGVSVAEQGKGDVVPSITIDSLGLNACHLIKADVEGMEREVLLGARQTIAEFQPLLYLENDRREKSPDLIRLIQEMDYSAYWHLPTMFSPNNYRGDTENVFGNILSVNVLCLPRDNKFVLKQFKKIEGPNDWWRSS
ncbi:MAG: FkbM family methyltransferase [Paracoccaceae bacterium]